MNAATMQALPKRPFGEFNPDCPVMRAERAAHEEANFARHMEELRAMPKQVYLPALSVGSFDANGNAKGSGWWL